MGTSGCLWWTTLRPRHGFAGRLRHQKVEILGDMKQTEPGRIIDRALFLYSSIRGIKRLLQQVQHPR